MLADLAAVHLEDVAVARPGDLPGEPYEDEVRPGRLLADDTVAHHHDSLGSLVVPHPEGRHALGVSLLSHQVAEAALVLGHVFAEAPQQLRKVGAVRREDGPARRGLVGGRY